MKKNKIPDVGLDLVEKVQRYADKNGIEFCNALYTYNDVDPEAVANYEQEKKDTYDVNTTTTDIESERIVDEVTQLLKRLTDPQITKQELDGIRMKLAELEEILRRKELS